jgi:hypothetical protein
MGIIIMVDELETLARIDDENLQHTPVIVIVLLEAVILCSKGGIDIYMCMSAV